MLKKRSGAHEQTIRELTMASNGIRIGAPLDKFQGIFTGTPKFVGGAEDLMKQQRAADDDE